MPDGQESEEMNSNAFLCRVEAPLGQLLPLGQGVLGPPGLSSSTLTSIFARRAFAADCRRREAGGYLLAQAAAERRKSVREGALQIRTVANYSKWLKTGGSWPVQVERK